MLKVEKDSYKDKELPGFSNYPKDLRYYNNANSLVVGKMKDEIFGVLIKRSCSIRI